MLEVATDQGDKLIVMSSRAHDALTDDQRARLGSSAPWSTTTCITSKPAVAVLPAA